MTRSWSSDLVAGVAGGAAIAVLEVISLHSANPSLWWVPLALLATLGLLVGAVIALQGVIVRRLALQPLRGAILCWSAGALLPLVPLGRRLFDGARAATLPGAHLAPLWVPLIGAAAVAAGAYAHTRFGRPRVSAVALALFAGVVELANRKLYRSGYPHIHLFLSVASVTAAALSLRLVLPDPGVRVRRAIPIAAVALFALSLAFGLRSASARWAVATHGVHTRHVVRVVRQAFDLDRDGYAAVLGGPDCDDTDGAVHPLADDRPGNHVDEDCDGVDAPAVPAPPPDGRRELAAWMAQPDTERELAARRGGDVVLITIDALRADLLADTPENRRDFPNIFSLLDESRVFRRAFSPAAGTDVAVPALLTGRLDPFGPVERTLPEALGADGYATGAVLPTEVLRWVGEALITRGFDDVDRVVNDRGEEDVGSYTTAEVTTKHALALLGAAPSPAFLWVHYFDLHEHHQIDPDDSALRDLAGDGPLGPRRKYRLLLCHVDAQIGRLLAALRAGGRWDRAVVVLTSDHGESLGEDPRLPDHHGELVYNPLVHVPLAIRVPGVRPGAVDATVSLVDVAPTLAALAGRTDLPGADGAALLPFLLDGAPAALTAARRPALLHETQQVGVIDWPYKLLLRPQENLIELYDLSSDFAERRDLSQAQPERVRELTQLYRRYPAPRIDRSQEGRRLREAQGRAPQPR